MINFQINDLKDPSVMQSRLFYKEAIPNSVIVNRLCYSIEELKEYLDSLKDIDIIDIYNKIINNFVGGFIFGNITNNELKKVLKTFDFNYIDTDRDYNKKEIISVGEKEIVSKDTTQSYLYIVYDINNYQFKNGVILKDAIYTLLSNMLNGSTSPYFETLRTKLGIVYSCGVKMDYRYGFMTVTAQIDKKNKNVAISAIDEIFVKLHDKKYIKEIFEDAKERIKENYITCQDKIGYQIDEVCNYTYKIDESFSNKVKKIDKITINDVLKEINNLEKKFVFFYKGDKDEK